MTKDQITQVANAYQRCRRDGYVYPALGEILMRKMCSCYGRAGHIPAKFTSCFSRDECVRVGIIDDPADWALAKRVLKDAWWNLVSDDPNKTLGYHQLSILTKQYSAGSRSRELHNEIMELQGLTHD